MNPSGPWPIDPEPIPEQTRRVLAIEAEAIRTPIPRLGEGILRAIDLLPIC